MVRHRRGHLLRYWIEKAELSGPEAIGIFAGSVRQDFHAMTVGLTLPYGSGVVGSHVNRIKTVKHHMYGRASFPLVAARVVLFPENLLPRPEDPVAVKALGAREAALCDDGDRLDAFAEDVLGLWRGGRWREAVSTVLIGDWANPLFTGGRLDPPMVSNQLKAEAPAMHRRLTPLWRRRANGSRILLLDTSLGDGLTLHHLVAGSPSRQEMALGTEPDDVRAATILNNLLPSGRAVTLAWAHPGVGTWAKAALHIGAADPVAPGERVRRKLKRLGTQNDQRLAAANAHRQATQR